MERISDVPSVLRFHKANFYLELLLPVIDSVHNICISSKAKAISSWPSALEVFVLANSCR